ncbi:MAG TPA: hypothetical protein VNU84_05640 [Candidatus Acidoferrum sp.]|jgi:hypothetical protein|nr:hypothetical protein [Candidatus Acidoferrum sp.]
MRQVLHIFKKDVRYLRAEICLVAALTTILAWKVGQQWAQTLLALAATYLIARLVHAEAIPGDHQFWITRPYRWQSLLGAKILFTLAFVSLPTLLAQMYMLKEAGFAIAPNLPAVLWSQILNVSAVWLSVAALASVTPSILPFNFAAFALVAVGFIFEQSTIFHLTGVKWPVGFDWIRNSFGLLAIITVTLCVLCIQYKKRRTLFSRLFAVAGLTMIAVAYLYLPSTWAMNLQTRFPAQRTPPPSLQFELATPAESRSPARGWADVPLAVNGVPDNEDLEFDYARFEFQAPDGRLTQVDVVGANRQSTTAGAALFDFPFRIPASLFKGGQGDAVTFRASFYLTLFGNPRTKTIPLRRQPQDVADRLRCSLGIFNRFVCESPFRWPSGIVYVQTGGAIAPLGYLVSYSPFPAGINLDDSIEGRWTSVVSPFASEATVTVKEPVAHFRRDIRIANFRISDFSDPQPPTT